MTRLFSFVLFLLCGIALVAQSRTAGTPAPNQAGKQTTSQGKFTAANLIDVNRATTQELQGLGLAPMEIERLTQGRPYKDKTELLSRHILSQTLYNKIQSKVGPLPSTGVSRNR